MQSENLEKIYYARPFCTRNADEFDLKNILDLFIDPMDGLMGPFDFTNSIIKGKMGSGKTMYLRANHAYYLYTLVGKLLEGSPIILPVYIKLSDFQNIHNSEQIYYAIIIKIVEEIVAVRNHLKSADELACLHRGASTISNIWTTDKDAIKIINNLKKITADEYVEQVSKSMKGNAGIAASFVSMFGEYSKDSLIELKGRKNPAFQDIVDACEKLLMPFDGKLLILFDEIGSLDKNFFKRSENSDSYFETLMNQLRTLSYVRTKLAVYPNTYSDILTETRYGDNVILDCDISRNQDQYELYLNKALLLIERYIEKETDIKCHAEDVFEISVHNQLLIEQIINASEGNMRRLVHLLDSAMNIAYIRNSGKGRVSTEDVLEALRKQGANMEALCQDSEEEFLYSLVKLCKNRSTYKFTFPNRSTVIGRYTNISGEYNIINIQQSGTGRQSNVYAFDYAYCVYKDIPTHYIKGTEGIDKSRSRKLGDPIKRIAQLSDDLVAQSSVPGKECGKITFLNEDKSEGIVEAYTGNLTFLLKIM